MESLVFKTCPLIPEVGFKTVSIYYIEFPWMQIFLEQWKVFDGKSIASMTASRNPKHGEYREFAVFQKISSCAQN